MVSINAWKEGDLRSSYLLSLETGEREREKVGDLRSSFSFDTPVLAWYPMGRLRTLRTMKDL